MGQYHGMPHALHFEREKNLFRTFSGAAERFNELSQKPCV